MKIAHVTATFPPYWAGTGNVAYHNARLMHERGHEVTVFTAATSNDSNMDFPFKVERLSVWFRVGNAPLTPSLLWKLKKFEIIHLHYPYIFGAELTRLAAFLFDTTLVITYHNDLIAKGWRGYFFRLYSRINQRYVLSKPAHLAVTSKDYAENSKFARTAPLSSKRHVLPNGVDVEIFKPNDKPNLNFLSELGLSENTPYVLFVGTLDKAHYFKGLHVLLKALEQLPDTNAVIVGDGDLHAHYQRLVQERLKQRVKLIGKVSLDGLVALYQTALVTVLPSITQGEAFGMVLIESMACGTPVIASDLPGVRTIVDTKEDGLLFPASDTLALVQALKIMLSDEELRKSMVCAGREKVLKYYDWQVVSEVLERLYRELL